MRLRTQLQRFFSAILAGSCLLTAMPILPAAAETVPEEAVGSVTSGGKTMYFYDTPGSGGLEAMWVEAVRQKNATVTLYQDWKAVTGTRMGTADSGFVNDGVICVPLGCEITIDLNGYNIDRTLVTAIPDGEVIFVQSGATLNLTDTKSASGRSGKVTGGNTAGDAGGIFVEGGGTFNMWGGSVSGNTAAGAGGGVFLGDQSTFYMTGGTVSDNRASESGGGMAAVNSSIRVVSGQFTKNSAGLNGGGMYLQGGATELNACSVEANTAGCGGGICTSTEAALSLKNGASVTKNIASSSETQSAGGGILAMSYRAIRVSGTVDVTSNRLSNGVTSDLSFWLDSENPYNGPRIEDDGVSSSTRIGVSFTSGKGREMVFAANMDSSIFTPATEGFEIKEKDGILSLRRPFQMPDTSVLIWIAVGLLVVIVALICILTIARSRKKKRRRRKSAKHKKQA